MTKQIEAQSSEQIRAVSTQWATSRAPDGLIINSQNGAMVQMYLAARAMPVTLANLSTAVEALAPNLLWSDGYGPAAPKPVRKLSPAQEQANKEQRLMDVGILPQRVFDHANRTESQSDIEFQLAKKQIAAATERMTQEARGKSAAATAAVATPAQIPLHACTSELKQFNATQIRNWMGRRRRAGLSV
jgi:hypothetical protein